MNKIKSQIVEIEYHVDALRNKVALIERKIRKLEETLRQVENE